MAWKESARIGSLATVFAGDLLASVPSEAQGGASPSETLADASVTDSSTAGSAGKGASPTSNMCDSDGKSAEYWVVCGSYVASTHVCGVHPCCRLLWRRDAALDGGANCL